MKWIIGMLVSMLIVLFLAIIAISVLGIENKLDTNEITEATTEEKYGLNIYTEQEHAKYDEVFESDTPTIYYYYQPTCHYCNSVKDQMTELALEVNKRDDIDLVMIDLLIDDNSSAWYDFEGLYEEYGDDATPLDDPNYSEDPADLKSVEDIQITGTPTVMLVEDGEVKSFGVGGYMFDPLEYAKEEFGLETEFDASQYGAS